MRRRGLTMVEVLVVTAILVLVALLFIAGIRYSPEGRNRVTCYNNLRQFGQIYQVYASEDPGLMWPPMLKKHAGTCTSSEPIVNQHHLFPNGPSLYPEYWKDPSIALCPSGVSPDAETYWQRFYRGGDDGGVITPCRFWDIYYQYLGWAILPEHFLKPGMTFDTKPKEITDLRIEFLTALPPMLGGGAPPGGAWPQDDPRWGPLHESDIQMSDGTTIYRLKQGIERMVHSSPDPNAENNALQARIPVMWDIAFLPQSPVAAETERGLFNHYPAGGNALFMDGHVEFIKLNKAYPIADSWAGLLELLWKVYDPYNQFQS